MTVRLIAPAAALRAAAALLPVVVLGACGGAGAPEETPEPDRGSVIGDPLQRSLDRAQAVQDTVDTRAQELRQRLEEAEN